ncbi:hypothetical protein VJ918_07855 [Adlercreutzia sp. R21]|uniref:Uncharacterized protein n=1 Tax=Adlercreutzia wanghongyangiae TaxID=3111451 RepID=A0ABU6IKR0_9ACTN|nr:hypothetical protein [Adlercreutzia sp. R21]MEC4177046.1 hypothetical protein [Adlercreutzia sp. R7]MEC4184720.1 hypothetical protein [Adlercreutzia sp. R21]
MTQPTTREDLQANLHHACQILNDFVSLQQQDAALRAGIIHQIPALPPAQQKKKEWRGAGRFLLCLLIGFAAIIVCVNPMLTQAFQFAGWGNDAVRLIGGIIVMVVTLAGPFVIAFVIKKTVNQSIQRDNERIDAATAAQEAEFARQMDNAVRHNQHTVERLNDLAQQMEMVSLAWRAEVEPWYPPSYVSVDAASFFAKAVDNQRADTLKEAINLYEEYLHRNHMEAEAARQTQLAAQLEQTVDARLAENNRLQKLQVVAGFANVAANSVTAANSGHVANNTASIANNMGQVASSMGQVAKNTGDIADKVNPHRNSLF